MTDDERARELWEQGAQRLTDGDPQEAEKLLAQSIAVKPTAEGYTYHGWALSYLGRLDEAIEDCNKAIEIDPDFGNPYNDIGVYLMQKGLLEEAILWLEKAKLARRYEPRYFPFTNLARIYEQKGRWRDAIREYQGALRFKPDLKSAAQAIARLRAQMN
jgi:tetratricopeptide (TPR) repeat protein